jgi:hypothetical protein
MECVVVLMIEFEMEMVMELMLEYVLGGNRLSIV